MRRFRFRLTPLLRLRAQLERNARRDLAAAVTEVQAYDQRLAAAAQGLRDCAEQGRDHGAKGSLARSLEVGLRRHQWRLQQGQQQAQQKLDAARAEFVVKTRERRTLQNLRDRRREEWRVEVQRAEQQELDELASLGRQVRGGTQVHGGNEA